MPKYFTKTRLMLFRLFIVALLPTNLISASWFSGLEKTLEDDWQTLETDLADVYRTGKSAFQKGATELESDLYEGLREVEEDVEQGARFVGRGLQGIGNELYKDVHKAAKGLKTIEKDVYEGISAVGKGLKKVEYGLEDGFLKLEKIAINLPHLAMRLGKDLLAIPGMLNRESGGLLAPIVKIFFTEYWYEFRITDYILTGLITGNVQDFKKAALLGINFYVSWAAIVEGLVKGIQEGNPRALETAVLMAFESSMSNGRALSSKLGQAVQKSVQGYQQLKKYLGHLENLKTIEREVEHGAYKKALITGLQLSKNAHTHYKSIKAKKGF